LNNVNISIGVGRKQRELEVFQYKLTKRVF